MMEPELASLPSSTSSRKKVGEPADSGAASLAASSTDIGDNGPATDGSTLTPEGSSLTEEVLGSVSCYAGKDFQNEGCPSRSVARPSSFSIDLDRTGGTRLGMSILEHVGHTLLVTAVTGGLMEEWNRAHRGQDVLVRAGDRIVEVNGIRNDIHLLLEECKKNQVLHMEMLRPPCEELAPGVHAVALDKTGCMNLGIDISQHDGRTLLVTEIRDGLVKEWNRENPCHQVRPGDRIIKVNSCQNNACRLLEECRKNCVLKIVIKKAKPRIDGDHHFKVRLDHRETKVTERT